MGCGSSNLSPIQPSDLPTNQVGSSKIPAKMEENRADAIVANSTGEPVADTIVDPNSQLSPQVKGRKNFGTAKMELDELYVELDRRCPELMAAKEFSSVECSDHLGFIREVSIYGRSSQAKKLAIADYLHSKCLAEIFLKVWQCSFPLDFLNLENQHILTNMKFAMIALWNSTDRSSALCERVVQLRVYEDIFRYLSDEKMNPEELDDTRKLYLVKGLLGVLHNTVQSCTAARQAYMDCSAVSIFRSIRAASNDMVKLKAALLLSYIINEDENEEINADSKNFTFIVSILESALKSPNHRSKKYGFQAAELITGLNKLAANDANKARIVESGALPFYVRLLEPECSEEEQRVASQGIWILSFKCSDAIKNEPGCLEGLCVLIKLGVFVLLNIDIRD